MKILSLLSVILFVSFSLAASTSWKGTYLYTDNAGKNAAQDSVLTSYEIKVEEDAKSISALIEIEGYQTSEKIKATGKIQGDSLVLSFKSYQDGKTTNIYDVAVYPVGSELFRITKEKEGKYSAEWKSIQPDSGAKKSSLTYQAR